MSSSDPVCSVQWTLSNCCNVVGVAAGSCVRQCVGLCRDSDQARNEEARGQTTTICAPHHSHTAQLQPVRLSTTLHTDIHNAHFPQSPYRRYQLSASPQADLISTPSPARRPTDSKDEARSLSLQRMDMVRAYHFDTAHHPLPLTTCLQHRHLHIRHRNPQHNRQHVRHKSPQLDGCHG